MTLTASLRRWSVTHRRIISLLGALMLAAALGIANAPVASAQPSYTCPVEGAKTVELSDGSAAATVYVNENCSDGQSHYSGVVRDINCDDRRAYLLLSYLPSDAFGWLPRDVDFDAPDGCHTEKAFSYDINDSNPLLVEACVVAENWWAPTASETECKVL